MYFAFKKIIYITTCILLCNFAFVFVVMLPSVFYVSLFARYTNTNVYTFYTLCCLYLV